MFYAPICYFSFDALELQTICCVLFLDEMRCFWNIWHFWPFYWIRVNKSLLDMILTCTNYSIENFFASFTRHSESIIYSRLNWKNYFWKMMALFFFARDTEVVFFQQSPLNWCVLLEFRIRLRNIFFHSIPDTTAKFFSFVVFNYRYAFVRYSLLEMLRGWLMGGTKISSNS